MPVYNERATLEEIVRLVRTVDLTVNPAGDNPILGDPIAVERELVIVDDGSTDGTRDILAQWKNDPPPDMHIVFHEVNGGKGAALRTGFEHATGDLIVIQDADLEYDPRDYVKLLEPILEGRAPVVYGSRFLGGPRAAMSLSHTVGNKMLTIVTNIFYGTSLSDMETCYKAVNTKLLKSIPIRSNDFRFEVEIVFKLAKRRARVFEVPIRYLPRTQEEGKKIKPKDGLLALLAMLHYWLIDDLYQADEYGSHILANLERARRFNLWMGSVLRPFVGDRVLEIGAGIGNLTSQFIPRELYVASDLNPSYLQYLRSYSFGKPYLRVLKIDASDPADFSGLEGQFDTALMINVLEHVPDPHAALRSLYNSLEPGGRAVILVPQHPWLYGTFDQVLEHRERYTAEQLQGALEAAGFRVEQIFDFNRFSVPGWWWNGKLFRRKHFSRIQLKLVETAMPVLKRIDRLWPWRGLSVIGIGMKE